MPARKSELDSINVVDGKLVRNFSADRLDDIIETCTDRIQNINHRITKLNIEKEHCKSRRARARALKEQLES